MIGRFKCLGSALLLVLILNVTSAYHQPGGYHDSGLSAAPSSSSYGGNSRAQEQQQQSPIFERDSACPAQFRGLKPYPHDCHRFINCGQGRPLIQSCGPGTAFHPLTLVCDHESKVPCGSSAQSARSARLQQLNGEPKCAPGVNGLEPHPYECTKFLNCANGQTFIQDCGPGTAFSPTKRICDFKHKVDCGDNQFNGAETDNVSGQTLELSCPPGTRALRPHPHDPHKYLRCGIGVQPIVEDCQLNEVFDSNSLTCVSSGNQAHLSSGRTSDLLCPDGVEGLFVHPFDQTKYLNCRAGKVAVQNCAPSQVFSISMGYCQPKAQLIYSDYVAYIVSEISYEYSLILTRCPAGTDGLHLYPYDAGKYIRCAAGGSLSVLSCDRNMAFSLSQRACRPVGQLTRSDRVKFLSELVTSVTGTYSYTGSQAFQSSLTSCPHSLQGKYAYPFNAGYFVLCQNGLLQVESCPRGTYYSLSKRSCSTGQQLALHEFLDYSYTSVQLSNNFMQDLTTITCPGNAQGYFLHPFDCTKFLNCRDQQTSIESCEQGKVFSISQRYCVARDQLETAYDRVEYLTEIQHEFSQENQLTEGRQSRGNEEISCPPSILGLYPHPHDCTKFLNCAHGVTSVQNCGPGTAFSATNLICDFLHKVDCGERTLRNNVISSHAGSESQFPDSHCPEGFRGLRPHPRDDRKYLRCGIGVQPIVEDCQLGEVFNTRTLGCVYVGVSQDQGHIASVSRTDLLCPDGVEGLFVHPFDQTKFLNCRNDKVAIQNCIRNYVFSISKGSCQPKAELVPSDYVGYTVSEISHEDSLILTHCPAGIDGLHLYPYDGRKYVRCAAGGSVSVLSCDRNMAFSLSQRACRPSGQLTRSNRVKFLSELVTSVTGTYSYTGSQAFQSSLTSCPHSLQGKFPYPFNAGYFVLCQNGLLQVESCPRGTYYSLSKRSCSTGQQLALHEFLDYSYTSVQLTNNFMQDLTTITCPENAQGYFLHPFDCTKFLNCRDQQTSIESCEQGKVFSISQRHCVARDQLESAYDRVEYLTEIQHEISNDHREFEGIYGANEGLTCPPNVYGLYAHPFDANNYFYCIPGKSDVRRCPSSNVFSISRGYCISEEFVPITDRVSRISSQGQSTFETCPRDAVGNYVYPFDCTKYLSCEAGEARIQSCPQGYHFSLSQRSCQPQGQVQRSNRVYLSSELKIFYDWWQQLHEGSHNIVCPVGFSGIYQHPTLSHKYISCSPEKPQAEIIECGNYMVFSISQRICVPPMGLSEPIVEETLGSYGWIDLRHDHREPKTYDQYASGSGVKTTTINGGDRWSSMNMQRPAGIGFGHVVNPQQQQTQPSGWSGQGSSYNHQAPTQSVLYVEGSLQPKRNYPQSPATNTIYKAPLAPMASTSGNVYYAQPVDEPQTWPRQNFSRKIDDNSPSNDWRPLPSTHHPSSLPGQRPVSLDYEPSLPANHRPTYREQSPSRTPTSPTHASTLPGQRPLDLDYEPSIPDNHRPTYDEEYPPRRPPAPASSIPGQRPLDLDYKPNIPANHRPTYREQQQPQPHSFGGLPPSLPGQRSLDLDYNPHTTNVDRQDQLPTETEQQPNFKPPVPVVYPNQPQPSDESNLYGGLQPPRPPSAYQTTTNPTTTSTQSNLRTFPIYPAMSNSPTGQQPNYPHYSPPYSEVAHSPNASWHKVPARAPDPFIAQEEYDEQEFDDIDSEQSLSTTTEKQVLKPPPFNHEFYNPQQSTEPLEEPPSKVALGEALRLMLRPYFNHSGTAPEDLAQRAESAIASVISKPPTTTTTTTSTTTTPRPTTPRNRNAHSLRSPDDDVELIVAGEQASLDDTDDDSVVPGAVETARTEQTLNPTTYASGYDTTDFQRGTRRVDVESSTELNSNSNPNPNPPNWHRQGHSRRNITTIPIILSTITTTNMSTITNTVVAFIACIPICPILSRRHLNKNLNQNRRQEPEPEEEFLPNPNAEATTPQSVGIHFRSGFDEPCEFNCGAGKCVKQSEVCDGVNNCGNRKDEQQCEHLGYELRLTGGDSPHTGRVEVKVNGQWGFVCDDNFGLRDADVVCHELGFKMGAAEVRGNSFYEPTERNFNYAMDGVNCRGNETQLKDCDFKGWGVHNCGVDEVVGVVCKVPLLKCPNNLWLCHTSKECIPPAFVCDNTADCGDRSDESDAVCKAPVEYRLEGGRSPNEGRLEVKYHGVWGSVCDDDFNLKAAQVACNSLGYYGTPKIEANIFGPGKGPIWLDQVMCQGNETSIDKCSHWNWGEHNCNHTEDVSLHCTAGPRPRQQRLRTRLQPAGTDKSDTSGTGSGVSLSDIGLWERSSKALRTPRRCGIFKDDLVDEFAHPEQRVVKGSVARRGRHPWQATIRTRGRGGISSHWCGAVVISKRHLLTAAHCLYGHPKGAYFVRVGDHYANIAEHSEVDSFIEKWYTHEQFRQPTHMNNDIAVVVLKTPLKFSDYVQPICLPERGAPLTENRTCTISGWGSIKSGVSTPAQELRAAQLPILPDATCKQLNVYGDAMTEGMFCAGSMDESVDACEGDSGGPLVCSDEDGETLYGIISWGQHCGYQNRPGVYVRVCHYIDWIYEKINQSLLRF
ncbi:hypothetical protein ACLKA6_011458 [Drosophila palustris]